MTKNNEITVVDSIMGSGKTTWAINYMNEASPLTRFIYVTPFLDEVKRIKTEVTNRTFIEPNNANEDKRKLTSLKGLIVRGDDIVTTHSLFKTADDELIDLLTDSGYVLILDEVLEVVEPVKINPRDIKRLVSLGDIEIVDHRVNWIGEPDFTARYSDIYYLASVGNLFCHRDKMFVWSFPPSVFRAMSEVFVMTYLFEGSLQRYYFDLHQFEYERKAVIDGELVDYNVKSERREDIYKLMDIYDGKLNDIAKRKNALSSNFLKLADVDIYRELRNNTYNFFRHTANAKTGEVYWSTLQEIEKTIAPRGYKNDSIPHNARATNEYKHCRAVAYLYNRYAVPSINAFFEENGVKINEELMATGDLLQWLFRSCIREGKPVQAYIPSSRMRGLLEAWAKYEI